jgi:hypothetical protein
LVKRPLESNFIQNFAFLGFENNKKYTSTKLSVFGDVFGTELSFNDSSRKSPPCSSGELFFHGIA